MLLFIVQLSNPAYNSRVALAVQDIENSQYLIVVGFVLRHPFLLCCKKHKFQQSTPLSMQISYNIDHQYQCVVGATTHLVHTTTLNLWFWIYHHDKHFWINCDKLVSLPSTTVHQSSWMSCCNAHWQNSILVTPEQNISTDIDYKRLVFHFGSMCANIGKRQVLFPKRKLHHEISTHWFLSNTLQRTPLLHNIHAAIISQLWTKGSMVSVTFKYVYTLLLPLNKN